MSSDRDIEKRIADNVASVRSRMAAAAIRSGRLPTDVQLVAVTKYVGEALTHAIINAGCSHLGESRPQELWEKAAKIQQADRKIHWHMIGHMQRNKVRRTLPFVSLIHSVDSLRLLQEIDEQSRLLGLLTRVLIEVNVSGDVAKDGLTPSDVQPILEQALSFPGVEICGFMAMSGLESDDAQTRREFALLRELQTRLQADTPASVNLAELSMGMSGDFEVAIEEGATIVRVGSSLFEGVQE